jgi:predicted MFS family arabinose efflux permease
MSDTDQTDTERRNLIFVLCGATFLIFFQGFMVAPLIPYLAETFNRSVGFIGLIEPAYLVAYGSATLVYGPLSTRWGRKKLILGSLGLFILLTGVTAGVPSAVSLIVLRVLTALGASAVVPLSLVLIGDLYEYDNRGRALGWLFAAMQGGMAAGSTLGAVLTPFIGWRGLFLGTAVIAAVVFAALLPYRSLLTVEPGERRSMTVSGVLSSFADLLSSPRGGRTYGFVFLNALIHAGVYTWLGLYFSQRYGLGVIAIGLAILGYGVPGFLLGPTIGNLADQYGRKWFIPTGLAVAGVSIVGLSMEIHVLVAAFLVATLSLGYDLTQPLFAGIVTDLGDNIAIAMGLNVFALFTGFGIGSFVFNVALQLGLETALVMFGIVALVAATAAAPLFRAETTTTVAD